MSINPVYIAYQHCTTQINTLPNKYFTSFSFTFNA